MTKSKSKPMVRIHDLSTNEVIDREMTDDEYKEYQANQVEQALIKADAEAKAVAKAAILDRIGLTVDELKTILG